MHLRVRSQGFSLVELSIVLVILGLLVGGVLSGQALIRAAELRSITSDRSRYVAAVQTFRDKYFALPGDMTNAEQFWGTDPSGCPNNTNKTPRKQTCNGDGNGQIGAQVTYSSGIATYTLNQENFRFWQHLSDAGLIEGLFSGVSENSTKTQSNPNHNVPRSKASLKGVTFGSIMGVSVGYVGSVAAGTNFLIQGEYGNVLNIGSTYGNNILAGSGALSMEGGILPDEMWNIDQKLDDGKPFTGSLRTNIGFGCEDFIPPNPYAAEYNLGDYTGASCSLVFANAF